MYLPPLGLELFSGGRGSRILEYSISNLVPPYPIRKPELIDRRIPAVPRSSSLQRAPHQAGFPKEASGRNSQTRHWWSVPSGDREEGCRVGQRKKRNKARPQLEPCFSPIPRELCNKNCTAKLFSPLHPGLISHWLWAAGRVLGGVWGSKGDNFASNVEDRKGICELLEANTQGSWGMGTSLEWGIGAGHPAVTTGTHSFPFASHFLIIRLYNRDPKLKCLQEEAWE